MEAVIIQNILESLPIGLLVINPYGKIILANRSASAILGYPAEFIEGKGWGDLFLDDEDNDPFNQVLVDVICGQQLNLHRSVPYVRANGEVLQLSTTTSYIRAEQELVGIVVLLDDVTEIHALHLQEKTILEEKHLLQKERTESLNKLAMAIAHQLRNPTMAIGGFAALLLKQAEPGTLRAKYLHSIVSSSRRLEDLVRAVSDYASLPSPSLRTIPVNGLYEPMQKRVRQKATELSRDVDLIISRDSFDVEIDPDLFAKALDEILDNAVESLASGQGTVEVTVSQEEKTMLIHIQDNGVGIVEKDMPYIFDPFFTTKPVGVGMGLCRARRIIAEHKGYLRIESTDGNGTKVLIRIPRTKDSSTS